jgi:hypothetical protein
MCLDLSTKLNISLKKEHDEYVGWKIYRDEKRRFFSYQCSPQYCGKPQKVGIWMNEKHYRWDKTTKPTLKFNHENGRYPKGFHIYLTIDDACSSNEFQEVIRKVYFRQPLQFGYQENKLVVVAKFIKLLRKKNNVRSKPKKCIS